MYVRTSLHKQLKPYLLLLLHWQSLHQYTAWLQWHLVELLQTVSKPWLSSITSNSCYQDFDSQNHPIKGRQWNIDCLQKDFQTHNNNGFAQTRAKVFNRRTRAPTIVPPTYCICPHMLTGTPYGDWQRISIWNINTFSIFIYQRKSICSSFLIAPCLAAYFVIAYVVDREECRVATSIIIWWNTDTNIWVAGSVLYPSCWAVISPWCIKISNSYPTAFTTLWLHITEHFEMYCWSCQSNNHQIFPWWPCWSGEYHYKIFQVRTAAFLDYYRNWSTHFVRWWHPICTS